MQIFLIWKIGKNIQQQLFAWLFFFLNCEPAAIDKKPNP